jgi:hypothetical protein
MRKEAFSEGSIDKVFLPASLTEIDSSAFSDDAWKTVKFEGAPLLVADGDFLCSQDSGTNADVFFMTALSYRYT